jgi:regulator of protease activity HflC (stomatin/prohibitin superfamily)
VNKNGQRGEVSPGLLLTIGVVVVVAAMSVGIATCAKLVQIDPGHVGVSVQKCGDAKIAEKPIPVGYYWRELFCEQVIEYPTSMQSLILTKSPHEGGSCNKTDGNCDESLNVTSSEGLGINLDVALNFTLDPAAVPKIYERWRSTVEDIGYKYIRQTIREGLQITFAKYTAEELYSTKKEVARAESEVIVRGKLEPMGFLISQFTINRVEPPAQVIAAINAKVAMIQDAQRSEQEVRKKTAEAAQKVAVAQGDADAARAAAAGEAASITLRAEAQAKANRLLADSVTAPLIQYEQARKWDGKLPTMTGGALPMISLK